MLTDTTIRRLETLGDLARQGKRINGLMRLMETPALWLQAYANIHGNKGAATQGVDGSSLDGFSTERVKDIVTSLKTGKYRFSPVRRVYIPKSNGKQRPLGIPTGNDKLVQEVARMVLEKIYEPVFTDSSHGFRQGRSCHTALSHVRQYWTGVKWLVNMDIKGYFDNINHDVLIGLLARRIDDPRFLDVVKQMLKAGYVENWKFHGTYSGTPQGGVISPILANIYLHELDQFMVNMKAGFDEGKRRAEHREYKNLSETIKRTMKRIDRMKISDNLSGIDSEYRQLDALRQKRKELPSSDPMDARYKRLVYIRYADDTLIGIIGSKQDAVKVMQDVTEFLQNTLKLEIAAEKSGVVHASDGVRFLGYEVRTYTGNRVVKTTRGGRHTTTRSVSERMQLHIPEEKLHKFCEEKGYGAYGTFKPIHRSNLLQLSEAEIVQTYNAEMRGIANYYSPATNAKRDLNKLLGLWHGSLLKTLAGKRRSTVSKVAKSLRHATGEALVVNQNGKEYRFPVYNLSLMGQKLPEFQRIDLTPNTWQWTLSHTELIQRMAVHQCEYCGTKQEPLEVHHIRKLADVKEGKQLWQIMMARRQRKTLVVCRSCHEKLHAGTLGEKSQST